MTDASAEERRRLNNLMFDEKLLRSPGGHSLGDLERAQEMAKGLTKVWAQRVAYRLAHLKMRTASTDADLEEVEELFLEAAKSDVLRARARIYRLAALRRHSDVAPRRLEVAAKQAAEAVEAALNAGGRVEPEDRPIQHELLNLAELAMYFVGGDYEPLEGLGAIKKPDTAWVLLGPSAILKAVSSSEALIKEELAEWRAHPSKPAIYVLPGEGEPEFTKPGEDQPEPRVPAHVVRLLALVQARSAANQGQLTDLVAGELSEESFRGAKRKLCGLLGIDGDDLFDEGPPLGPGPTVNAYGAVCWRALKQIPDATTRAPGAGRKKIQGQ